MNKYELISNLTKETKEIYEKHYLSEKYELIVNEDNMILAKKTDNEDINLNHEEIIIKVIKSMIKKYNGYGILYINLTKEINSILDSIKEDTNLRTTDNRISWPIRQAIVKAIADKKI